MLRLPETIDETACREIYFPEWRRARAGVRIVLSVSDYDFDDDSTMLFERHRSANCGNTLGPRDVDA
jgi:hypothetical protein